MAVLAFYLEAIDDYVRFHLIIWCIIGIFCDFFNFNVYLLNLFPWIISVFSTFSWGMNSLGIYFIYCSRVRNDIINSLKMKDPQVTIGSFDRTNLFYGVKSFNRGPLFMNEFVLDISKYVASGGSTIIYCTTIKDVEQVYSFASSSYKRHFQVH